MQLLKNCLKCKYMGEEGENYICIFHKADLCQIFHVSLQRVNMLGCFGEGNLRHQHSVPTTTTYILLCNPPGPSFPHGITMILNTWVNLDKVFHSESYQMSDTTVILFSLASSLLEEVPWDTWGYHDKENELTDVFLPTLILLSRWSITEEIRVCLKKFRYYVNIFSTLIITYNK